MAAKATRSSSLKVHILYDCRDGKGSDKACGKKVPLAARVTIDHDGDNDGKTDDQPVSGFIKEGSNHGDENGHHGKIKSLCGKGMGPLPRRRAYQGAGIPDDVGAQGRPHEIGDGMEPSTRTNGRESAGFIDDPEGKPWSLHNGAPLNFRPILSP